ncbi:TetR/AcrR family transcriptional regulator [Streptomyces profundus]|uniref:TetR/AcrR family transcriptional regulator n=1 Tax=Streptomyces profundus TaxID=2867410 RepID=UPI001D165EDA|nr:TetR/AcrR family transcriptional regulator [Streptomyces sp. MA3_2.13]UED87617.1 TetR/AcrR family transcriptional regulator [Streptomyces sp. MA3_2.13]
MSLAPQPPGRRERNKRQKLERITAAARELFAERGIDEVTTQEIADKADVGTGTLFLYAKTKAELLLLVQNSRYVESLERGQARAEEVTDALDAVLTIVRPIVECNRTQVNNGRAYLREIVFGDPTDLHHREALDIIERTRTAVTAVLRRKAGIHEDEALTLAHVVSAIMFVSLASTAHVELTVDDIERDIRKQIGAILPR